MMNQRRRKAVSQDPGDVWLIAAGVFHAAASRLDPSAARAVLARGTTTPLAPRHSGVLSVLRSAGKPNLNCGLYV